MVFTLRHRRYFWWTKTKDLSLAAFVRPPAIVHFSIVICVSRDCLQTTYTFQVVNDSAVIRYLGPVHTSAFSFETRHIHFDAFRPSVHTNTLSVFGETASI